MRDAGERLAGAIAPAVFPGLRVLVLFGSRARGDARPGADWDFAYLATLPFDPDVLLAHLTETLGADRVDLVDLACAGGQVRYRAARDGRVLYEAEPGLFARFRVEAVLAWCDMVPVLERAYAGVLDRLQR